MLTMDENFKKIKDFFDDELSDKDEKEWLSVVRNPSFDRFMYENQDHIFDSEIWRKLNKPFLMSYEITDKIIPYLDFFDYAHQINEIPEEFLIRYKNYVSWMHLLRYRHFSEDLLRKCLDELGVHQLLMTQKLSSDFVFELEESILKLEMKFHIDNFWSCISGNENVDESILLERLKLIDWVNVSKRRNLSGEFLFKFQDKLDWKGVSHFRGFTLEECKRYYDKIEWDWLSSKSNLDTQVIEHFSDKLNVIRLIESKNDVPLYLIEQEMSKFDSYTWEKVSREQKLTYDFIMKNIDELSLTRIISYNKKTMDSLTTDEKDQLVEMKNIRDLFVN